MHDTEQLLKLFPVDPTDPIKNPVTNRNEPDLGLNYV
jgi:hypothetical protein